IEAALMGVGGESMVSEQASRHIVTRVTDEGLIVEIFDLEDEPLFQPGTDDPAPILEEMAAMLVNVFALVDNQVAVNGHIRALPEVLLKNPSWDLSATRAMRTRLLLEAGGLPPARMQRITGYADRKPALSNPMAPRNNRLEVILLRSRR
ncbi:MAG: chemotaxis protein MotB, partial [Albidovulum sp.]